jgi:hypothetical protein
MTEVQSVQRQIILNNVLLNRASITTPLQDKKGEIDPKTGKVKSKYRVHLLFPQTHPQFNELQALIRGVAVGGWKDQTAAVLEQIKSNNQRFCMQRGELYYPSEPAYKGMIYISAGNKDQPTILATENGVNIANRGTPAVLTPSNPQWPYSGCKVNAHLEFYTYDYNGKGLGCSVLGIQFFEHGERLRGSSVSTGAEFKPVAAKEADGAPPAAGAAGGLLGGSLIG